MAVPLTGALHFGEAALGEVGTQILLEGRAGSLGYAVGISLGLAPQVPQVFPKAEWVDQGLHGAASHAGRHLTRQEARGGA